MKIEMYECDSCKKRIEESKKIFCLTRTELDTRREFYPGTERKFTKENIDLCGECYKVISGIFKV